MNTQTTSNTPTVGEGATVTIWTDSHACTVERVSPNGKTVWLRQDKATLLNGATSGEPDAKSGAIYPCHPDDVRILDGRRGVLEQKRAEGYILCGATNQSGISRKPGEDLYVSEAQVQACIQRTCNLLGLDIDVLYAPDRGGPPASFWRKPCPGMGVTFIEKYKLDPAQCIMVGDMTSDQTFAERCGFQFVHANDFFRGIP